MDDLVKRCAEMATCQNVYEHEGVHELFAVCGNAIERLSARIAALEAHNKALLSGQPVNGWQLVPVSPSIAMIEAWASLALSRLMNPDANKGMTAATRENYAAMLTASAQEQSVDERKV